MSAAPATWQKTIASNFRLAGGKSRRSVRLRLDHLEARDVPSTAVALDFNTNSSPTAAGYTGVKPLQYSAATGFGWQSMDGLGASSRSTSNALTRDFHWGSDGTFLLDVPNGTYDVFVGLGEPSYARDKVSVWAEGQLLATDVKTNANQFLEVRGRVVINDGQFTLRLLDGGGVNPRFAIHKLLVTEVDANATRFWSDAQKPAVANSSNKKAIELGLRFQSTVAGYVTGIRFYKGSGNTGTHTGSLWSANGTRLATATFTNETTTGWQQVWFSTPVAIQPNTTYVASYFAPRGRQSVDTNYFAISGLSNGSLTVLPTSQGGGGTYVFGSAGGFPTQTSQSSNYWVDVIFAKETTPPTVSSVTPADQATNVSTSTSVAVTFSEAVDPATVNGNTFMLKTAGGSNVAATLSYDPATFTASLTPSAALSAGATYTVTVKGGSGAAVIRDMAGNALAADFTSTFTTAGSSGPPTANAGADKSSNEGSSVSFTGSASGGSGALSYHWDFGDGGTADGTLTPSHTYADNGSYTVTLTVTDAANQTATDTATVTVSNVAPTGTLSNNGPVSTNATVTISFSNQNDVSSADRNAGYRYSYDFDNNGTWEQADVTSASATTSYATAGSKVVKARIKDKDGGFTDYTTTVTVNSGDIIDVDTVAELQAAIANLVSGRTIRIAAGTYQIPDTLWIPQNISNITIIGATGNAADVIIKSTGMATGVNFGFWSDNTTNLTIADLTIRDFQQHGIILNAGVEAPVFRNLRIIDIGDQHIKANPNGSAGVDNGIVENCVIEFSSVAPDTYTNGVDVHNGDNWIIRNNIFRNFRTTTGLAGPALLMWNGSSGTIAERNTFINNHRDIAFGLVSGATADHTGGIIRNNFISRPSGAGGDVAIGVANSPNTQVLHNTVRLAGAYPNAVEYRFSTTTGVQIRNNLTDAAIIARDGATGTVSGNVTNAQASWFVNAANHNLHLTGSATAAIDTASTLAAVPADIDGQNRPIGPAPDVGADEYQPSGPAGLVAAFGFDEGSGTTVGSAAGGLAGTISGATWSSSGKYGNALSFDGTNDWVTVADSNALDLTTGMTLEAWVRPTTLNGWETVILKEGSNDLAYALYADNNGNDNGGPRRPGTWIRQSGSSYYTLGTSQVAVNQWTHLATTYDGSALKLFVNGSEISSLNRSGAMDTTGNPLRFGGNNVWSEWFNGLIDEVRIYNRALSATEIQTDMNTPIGSDTAPPTVTAVAPTNGSTGVSTSTPVLVTFSEAMDSATINSNTVLLRAPGGSTVSATVSYNAATWQATLTPSSTLSNSATYTFVVVGGSGSTVARDVAGNALAADFNSTFTTSTGGPPIANAGSDKTANEASSVSFAGSASEGTGTLTYQWDFGDGQSASGTLTPTHTYADNGTYTVTLTVTDSLNRTGTDTATVTVNNVAPTATLSNNGPVGVGAAATISFSNQNDVSTPDKNAGFSYRYDFNNDGVFDLTTTQPSATQTWNQAGNFTVKGRIVDKDGGYNDYTTVVRVGSTGLLTPSDLAYVGAFRVPAGTFGSSNFGYGGTALAYNPVNNSLFIVGHDWDQAIAEISIPNSIVNSSNVNSLATAQVLQPFSDIIPRIPNMFSGTQKIGGLQVVNGKLIGTAYEFYDADASVQDSHFVMSSLNLATAQVTGLFKVGNLGGGFVGGYMSPIPSEWQADLGAPYLTGQAALSIISRTSSGPAAFGFNPNLLASGTNPFVPYVYYPLEHPLGNISQRNPYFNGNTEIKGVVQFPGTRSVIFFGDHGTGDVYYGEPEDANDPYRGGKGWHSVNGEYAYYAWAYDVEDFVAVKNGQMQPWDVRPYQVWEFDFPVFDGGKYLGGAAFDPATNRLFVTQKLVDGDRPLVHVYNVAAGSPLMAASIGTSTGRRAPSEARIERLLDEAIRRWEVAGFDVSGLGKIDVRLVDFSDATLARASGTTIWLDVDAAGNGWFVDRTPRNDSEFVRRGNQGEQGRMDLLTVLGHEVGHLLGLDHDFGSIMNDTLDTGTRVFGR